MSLFYVTRLTAHREMLLHGKISAVQTHRRCFGLAGPTPPPQGLSQKILNSVEVKWMAVETPAGRREFVIAGGPLPGVVPADLLAQDRGAEQRNRRPAHWVGTRDSAGP